MAARQNSGSTKQNKQYARKWQGIDRVALWIGGLIIAAVVGYVLFSLLGGFNMIEQRKMESYLREKYGKGFIVKNIKLNGAGLGVRGWLEAEASPEDNQEIVFTISDSGGKIEDQYVGAYLAKKEQSIVDNDIKAIFHNLPVLLKINIYLDDPPHANAYLDKTIDGVIADDTIDFLYDLHIRVDDITTDDNIRNGVKDTIVYLKTRKINKASIQLSYKNETAQAIRCVIENATSLSTESPDKISQYCNKE